MFYRLNLLIYLPCIAVVGSGLDHERV